MTINHHAHVGNFAVLGQKINCMLDKKQLKVRLLFGVLQSSVFCVSFPLAAKSCPSSIIYLLSVCVGFTVMMKNYFMYSAEELRIECETFT